MTSLEELLAAMTPADRDRWHAARGEPRNPIQQVLSLSHRIAHDVIEGTTTTSVHDLAGQTAANAFCAGAIFASTQPIAADLLIAFLKADGAPIEEHVTNGRLLAAHLVADAAQPPRRH